MNFSTKAGGFSIISPNLDQPEPKRNSENISFGPANFPFLNTFYPICVECYS